MPISFSSIAGGGGGGQDNNFALAVASSTGVAAFELDTEKPAGVYAISSANGDQTIEAYALNAAGEPVGISKGLAVETSDAFTTILVYGLAQGDVVYFDFSASAGAPMEPSAFNLTQIPPFLLSATPTDIESANDEITVTGGAFADGATARFIGANGAEYAAKSVTKNSSTEITVVRPDILPEESAPYTLAVRNANSLDSSVNANKLSNYFTAGGGVTWVTTSPLPSFGGVASYSTTLLATDADNGPVTYSVASGTLPAGLSLNSETGVISGASSAATQNVTIAATDSGGNSAIRVFELPGALELSGGIVTTDGTYTYHTFKTSGTLTAVGSGPAEILTIAGGGGSWAGGSWTGGEGGGAGGVVDATTLNLATGDYPVVIGAGGAGGKQASPGKGGDSSFNLSAIVATGGGGGTYDTVWNGGSGGAGGTGIPGQGNNGGPSNGTYGGGGGGKAAAASGATGGAGTTVYSTWANTTSTGVSGVYSKGGYGSPYQGGATINGAANSGNGASGGSGHASQPGGTGGSGVVIVRYVAP